LLVAGHETTRNLIGNGILALLRHPEALRDLQNDPTRIVSAIEELLGCDSPLQRGWRRVAEDLEINGAHLRKGQLVFLMLGAANRDPEVFPDPDRLDLGRLENRHLAFGFGIHFCLGAPLARLEARIALPTLLRRMPCLKLASDELQWQENIAIRGLKKLPVTF
jgi:cytochrome P450